MTPAEPESRQDLLGLALELHMYCTGSGPDMDERSVRHAIRFIRGRLSNWHDHGAQSLMFDEGVRVILLAVLGECAQKRAWDKVIDSELRGI